MGIGNTSEPNILEEARSDGSSPKFCKSPRLGIGESTITSKLTCSIRGAGDGTTIRGTEEVGEGTYVGTATIESATE